MYFSGPVFVGSEADEVLVRRLSWSVGEHGYEQVYSPGAPENDDQFTECKRAIDESNLVVIDTWSPWAWWELGYAYARDLPIIQYDPRRTALGTTPIKLMALACCRTHSELHDALGMLRDGIIAPELHRAGEAMIQVGVKYPCL